ncbi:hypothetical protein Lalb_Chr04g0252361 [Lupinus albus]|uniref:Uncharacterized protein n=1 Tax=Lupinus albus TaxID=3870 RepID=A0A6A4QMJ3_LUPAL|nr:hypothetical protein Lalb_Chr04g0252361 [Lupinus albus]
MDDAKNEELANVHAMNSMSDHTIEPDSTTKIANVESSEVLENTGRTIPKPHERVPNFPRSSINSTNLNDSLYESLPSPIDKSRVNTIFTIGRIRLTPSHSLASDLQVEVSEVGSPTLTIDDNHETNTTTDEESVLYDGDIDKDIASDSEEMWGASFNSRGVRGVTSRIFQKVHNWKDIASPLTPQIIDKENAADVSSLSSRSDMPEDTPTHAISIDHNIFGIVEECVGETDAPRPPHSSDVLARWKRLMRLMDKNVNHSSHETHSEKPEEKRTILSEDLITEAQVINDVNNSATTEQDSTHNSRSYEDNTSIVEQETIDDVSINSGSSYSSRSILSENTIADQVSFSTYNQEMQLSEQQSNIEVIAEATSNSEGPLDTMHQNNQPSMVDLTVESHNSDFRHSQV